MNNLTTPKTKIAKVLYALILGRAISEQDFRINSFRSILSDLRKDYRVPIRHVKEFSNDEFGKRSWYFRHYLLTIDRKKALRTYKQLNN